MALEEKFDNKIPYGLPLLVGNVKWFNNAKGFGFIEDGDGANIFVHHSSIGCPGYRTLTEGQKVLFAYIDTTKGLQAVFVVPAKENYS